MQVEAQLEKAQAAAAAAQVQSLLTHVFRPYAFFEGKAFILGHGSHLRGVCLDHCAFGGCQLFFTLKHKAASDRNLR